MSGAIRRGGLRIYLGYAPGVGKTTAMIAEAHRQVRHGIDVVVGLIDTRERPEGTITLGDLEVIPRMRVRGQDASSDELDTAAVIARKPRVVLVDDFAHSNAPGSERRWRWQDVEVLRDAGISVVTAVDISEIDVLRDVIETIADDLPESIVPARIVRGADEVDFVDLSPRALRRRIADGDVYRESAIDAALVNRCSESVLAALRELALVWMGDVVDQHMHLHRNQRDHSTAWATRTRVVAAIPGGTGSEILMRRAAMLAGERFEASWHAVHVDTSTEHSDLSPERREELRITAANLGGRLHVIVGENVAEALLDFARAENASHMVIGHSPRSWVSKVIRPTVGIQLLTTAGDIDVVVVPQAADHGATRLPRFDPLSSRRRTWGYSVGLIGPLVVSGILWLTRGLHGLPTEAITLMAVVVLTALLGSFRPAVLSAIVSGLLLSYLFSPPLYSLKIDRPENLLAVALFIGVGIMVATVVDTAARSTREAFRARREADALTELSHRLLGAADDLNDLLASAAEQFGADGAAVIERGGATGDRVLATLGEAPLSIATADLSSDIDQRNVLIMTGRQMSAERRSLLNAYAAYATVISDRRRAIDAEVQQSRLEDAARTRTALLTAVSHDLRSPLAAAKVAVGSLRNREMNWSQQDRDALLETIEDSTDRLIALVANLLDMSRINTGSVSPFLTDVNVARLSRIAISGLSNAGKRVVMEVPGDLAVFADPALLDRVLANILENALKYTPPEAEITVSGEQRGDRVVISVADRGPGVTAHDRLFAPFQRLGDAPQEVGVGLGLAVARGLTEAMGGSVRSDDTPGGGLTFIIDLPGSAESDVRTVDPDPPQLGSPSVSFRQPAGGGL